MRSHIFTESSWCRVRLIFAVAALGWSYIVAADHDPPPLPDPIPGSIPTGPFVLELADIASGTDFLPNGFPIDVESPPDGTARLVVTLRNGVAQVIDNGSVLTMPFLDVSTTLASTGSALSSIAFHPNFSVNSDPGEGKLYTVYQEPAGSGVAHFGDATGADNQSVVYEWQVSATDPNIVDTSSKREILRINEQIFVHNINDLAFGPDGYLYIAKGDDDANINATLDGTNIHGTILRIDIDDTSGNGRYSIPADNPFVGNTEGKLEEVYAYGFRNNWRISFDSQTGELYAGDIGEDDIEEIDLIQAGGNYGWLDKEGSFAYLGFNVGVTDDLTDLPPGFDGIDPIAEYDHTEGDRSITGGFVYRGGLIPSLRGHYVFGDLVTGRLMHLDPDTLTIQEISIDPAGDAITPGIIGFGETSAGELLIVFANTPFSPTVNRVVQVVSGRGFGIDKDGDGVDDDLDNCIDIPNGPTIPDAGGFSQRDTNGDGHGNVCDPDLNNDGVVNTIDLGLLRTAFFTTDPDADFNGDGIVNVLDLGVMRLLFFTTLD